MAIRIGCGSWGDADYAELLYPRGADAAAKLHGYAQVFDCVEVNSSFYATPKRDAVAKWVEQTPKGFLFDFKLHRAFSQSPAKAAAPAAVLKKKAQEPKRDLLAYTLEQVQPLLQAKKLGAFYLLLAPFFGPEKHTLEELDVLVRRLQGYPLAVELRHTGWLQGKRKEVTLAYFRERQITWVTVDMPKLKDASLMPFVAEITNPDLAYLRLHGRNKNYLTAKSAAERHAYVYTERDLKEIVARIKTLAAQARDVHVIANNHARDFAPRTARRLRELLA